VLLRRQRGPSSLRQLEGAKMSDTIFSRKDFPREYTTWTKINQRCYNHKNDAYSDYGGRGVTVYQQWRESFTAFMSYIGPRPSPDYSIDRYPNKNGNYEPGNVRWANFEEQNRNKRDNVWVTYNGELRLVMDVCVEIGFNINTAYSRHKKGIPDDRLFEPVKSIKCTAIGK
jgi:hypothetical protein